MASDPTIRYATQKDVPEILAMINELALFENAASSVRATPSSLLQTLSFPAPSAPSTGTTTITDPADLSFPKDFTPGFARTFLILANEEGETSEDGGKESVAGMALFFTNYSTWRGAPGVFLEDLFVRPAFRRRGFAGLLLKALARETIQLGGKRLEWSCLKWNVDALGFYDTLGAERMEEWVGLRVDGIALHKLAM